MTSNSQSEDFDIGKAIFDYLKDLSPDRQERVLRWVSEALGVSVGIVGTQLPQPQATGAQSLPLPAPVVSRTSPTDIKTFIKSKSPKSDRQFAAAIAYFYRFEAPLAERRDTIDANLLQDATRLVGRTRLSSPNDTLNNAKKAGYLDSPSAGDFSITTVGENLVAMTLPGDEDVQPAKKKAKKE
jgi:hypothetical protein